MNDSAHPLFADAVRILGELVAFQTEPPFGNLQMVARVAEILTAAGFRCRTSRTPDGEKDSLLATVGDNNNNNDNKKSGIVLSAHSDVVDATGQSGWQSPPFELRESGGKFYARGACDMKGFVACVLAQAPAFAQARLGEPLHFAMSRDEEIGCVGMPDILALLRAAGARPRLALVGEPTTMQVVAGHKSGFEMRTTFTGFEAHSSTPAAGVSAVEYAARFAGFLLESGAEMAKRAVAGSPFSPPYDTVNIGVIRGGTAKNIIAGKCELGWLYRAMPQSDAGAFADAAERHIAEVLLPQMRAGGHPAAAENRRLSAYPALAVEENSAAAVLARELTGDDGLRAVSFGSDAGHFQKNGIPAVVIGPGDIAQAHKPNEFITAAQLNQCLSFLDSLRQKMQS